MKEYLTIVSTTSGYDSETGLGTEITHFDQIGQFVSFCPKLVSENRKVV